MKNEMTLTDYSNQIKLGNIEQIKCLSVFTKLVKKYTDLKGSFEIVEIKLIF